MTKTCKQLRRFSVALCIGNPYTSLLGQSSVTATGPFGAGRFDHGD